MDTSRINFFNKEQDCESAFINSAPYWHITTPGTSSEIIFTCEDEFVFAINSLALIAFTIKCRIVAYAIMSNHIHIILSCSKEECLQIFIMFRSRLKGYMSRCGRTIDWKSFTCNDPIPIVDLEMLRNEIVYVNRNGYVALNNETPYSYKWGSGLFYFGGYNHDYSKTRRLTAREKRRIFHSAAVPIPENILFMGEMVDPSTFCDFEIGKSMFRDAHQYFNKLSKSYEAYSEIAKRLGDQVFLSDEEIYPATAEICRKHFNTNTPKLLGGKEKIELAIMMRKNLSATPSQIRRVLKLEQSIVAELFGKQ